MRRTSRAAFTLVEMLVAMAVTLVMMGAVVTLFGNIGNSISGSRASMEMSERLRNTRNVLQHDLGNVTVTMLPPRRPEMDEGYFEYIEGPATDFWPDANWASTPPMTALKSMRGDGDDFLAFTVRSRNEPYTGQVNTTGANPNSVITSQTAEVYWYTAVAENTPTIIDPATGVTHQLLTLYRRVLLIAPNAPAYIPNSTSMADMLQANDISCRLGTSLPFEPNTLGDLTKRENRWRHDGPGPAAFPFPVSSPWIVANIAPLGTRTYDFRAMNAPMLNGVPQPNNGDTGVATDRTGEEVILTNVLAFDVKVFDPTVVVKTTTSGVAVLPSDPGYNGATNQAGTGGYVDLNYSRYVTSPASNFSGPGDTRSGLDANGTNPAATYDTWSMHYDAAGIAHDGLDNGGVAGVVDDAGELTAPPPYPVPLRGIQVKIRVYEPDSRQVREVTVVQDFLPQ